MGRNCAVAVSILILISVAGIRAEAAAEMWWTAIQPKYNCKPSKFSMAKYTSYLDSKSADIDYEFTPDTERNHYYKIFQTEKKERWSGAISIWATTLQGCNSGAELVRLNLAVVEIQKDPTETFVEFNAQEVETLRKTYNELWGTRLTKSEFNSFFQRVTAEHMKKDDPSSVSSASISESALKRPRQRPDPCLAEASAVDNYKGLKQTTNSEFERLYEALEECADVAHARKKGQSNE